MTDAPGAVATDARLRREVDAASKTVLANHVEPAADMEAERRRARIDSHALAVYMNGGEQKLQRK